MLQVILGSLTLSVVHALIPNHWIPLVAIGKAENWSKEETLLVTGITGSVHTISTILIGLIFGLISYNLTFNYEAITRMVAPLILSGIGLVYLILDFRGGHNHHDHGLEKETTNKSKLKIIISLGIAMFFSPCLEIEAYFFTAGTWGWMGIFTVAAIYFVVTILGMLLFVYLGLKGVEKINFHFIEHHEKKIIGIILLVLGIVSYFYHF